MCFLSVVIFCFVRLLQRSFLRKQKKLTRKKMNTATTENALNVYIKLFLSFPFTAAPKNIVQN